MYKLKELTNDEFDKFSLSFECSTVYQTSSYALAMNNQNYDSILLGLINSEDEIKAATLILIGYDKKFKFAYSPRGFLIDYKNEELIKIFTNKIKDYLGKNGIVTLKINPPIYKAIHYLDSEEILKNNYYDHILKFFISLGYKHLGYNSYFEGIRPRFEAVINLTLEEEEIFNNLKKELKTKIRNAKKSGLKVIKGNIDNLNTKLDTIEYLKETNKQLEGKENEGIKITSKIQNNNSVHKNINKKMNIDLDIYKYNKQLVEATKLLKEYPNGLITSSVLVAKYKDEVTLLIDGHNKDYKNLNSKHLLIWELCKKYKKEGYKKFNLGGIASININD